MQTYLTQQGDAWDMVSHRVYKGNEGHVGTLVESNPHHANVVIFSAGIELTIPDMPEASPVVNLPPWRKAV